MEGYLGETLIDDDGPFAGCTKEQWALHWIEQYGQIDGDHHKAWVLDQVVRILKGTPVKVYIARWDNGEMEFRACLGDASDEYKAWLESEMGPNHEEDYNSGIAP
jgi:hypothetical protein